VGRGLYKADERCNLWTKIILFFFFGGCYWWHWETIVLQQSQEKEHPQPTPDPWQSQAVECCMKTLSWLWYSNEARLRGGLFIIAAAGCDPNPAGCIFGDVAEFTTEGRRARKDEGGEEAEVWPRILFPLEVLCMAILWPAATEAASGPEDCSCRGEIGALNRLHSSQEHEPCSDMDIELWWVVEWMQVGWRSFIAKKVYCGRTIFFDKG